MQTNHTRSRRFPQPYPQKKRGRNTITTQLFIAVLLFLFCAFVRLSPDDAFINIKNGISAILTVNTDLQAEWENIKSGFTEQDTLDTLAPVSTMCAPSSGEIVRGFGVQDASSGAFHYGVDLSCEPQENILCANDGTVTEIATNEEYGTFIIVSHSEEIATLYGGLGEIMPNVGDKVTKKQPIARVAENASSFYFELRRGDTFLDPAEFIAFKERTND